MTAALKSDIEAREVRDLLSRAALRGDPNMALEAAHRFAAAGLAITVCAGDFDRSADESSCSPRKHDAEAFGPPFAAKFPGRCALCDEPVAKGARAVYRKADRAIAHAECLKRNPKDRA